MVDSTCINIWDAERLHLARIPNKSIEIKTEK